MSVHDGLPLGRIVQGDVLEALRALPPASVHCIVTSPPYWGLRDYRQPGQWGLEPTVGEHLEHLVALGRELWRVLRPDGTWWLNYGDAYTTGSSTDRDNGLNGRMGRAEGAGKQDAARLQRPARADVGALKPKDLLMLPPRVALALQAEGWWVRRRIVWHKPNAMPESVTDRPAAAHEDVYLLARAERYYYDRHGVREPVTGGAHARRKDGQRMGEAEGQRPGTWQDHYTPEDRSPRDVWTIPTRGYPGAHFATYPVALAERCILLGTSARGVCGACGAPWVRVLERGDAAHDGETASSYAPGSAAHRLAKLRQGSRGNGREYEDTTRTLGWQPTCACEAGEPVPAVVLDPFAGSGTTGVAAHQHGRAFAGIDLAGGDCCLGYRTEPVPEGAEVLDTAAHPCLAPGAVTGPHEMRCWQHPDGRSGVERVVDCHTPHNRLAAAREGRPLREYVAHTRLGQGDLLAGLERGGPC